MCNSMYAMRDVYRLAFQNEEKNGQRALGQVRWQNEEKSLSDEAELFQKCFLLSFVYLLHPFFDCFHHELKILNVKGIAAVVLQALAAPDFQHTSVLLEEVACSLKMQEILDS